MMLVKRNKIEDIRKAMTSFPVVGIVGPRQVGKPRLSSINYLLIIAIKSF